jgi:hypothetical protein
VTPKRADAASWLPAIAMALFGGLLIKLGHALRVVDDNLADLED